MSDKKIKKDNAPEVKQLVVQEIHQVSVDRTPKDVSTWRDSMRIAESIQFPNRSRLLDLYHDVILDGHLTGVWQKRQASVTNKEIKFLDKSGKEVEELNELFETNEWEELLCLIEDAKLWGLSGIESIPGKDFKYKVIPRKHILIEKQMIKLGQNDPDGIPYEDNPFILVFGKETDLGLMLKCSFYALIKKGDFSDWAQYSEIFGQPMRVAYYDAYDDKSRIQLKEVLDNSGSSLALMIPNQAKFEVIDGKTSNGDGQLQERLKDACNAEMSIIILGNTETTANTKGGSNAKARVQQDGEKEIIKKDTKWLLSCLNSEKLLNLLANYGYPVDGGKFVIQPEPDPAKILEQVEIITGVRNSGTPVEDDYVYEITGIPKPENYNQLKNQSSRTPASFPMAKTNEPPLEDQSWQEAEVADSVWNKIRLKLADFFDPAP